MIRLTRLKGQPLIVNSELIEFIENTPDTVITLITGEKVIVLESAEQIVDLFIKFRQRIMAGFNFPTAVPPLSAISVASDKSDNEAGSE